MAASMASQYGGNLGQELARSAAAKLTGNQPQAVVTPEPVVTKEHAGDPEL